MDSWVLQVNIKKQLGAGGRTPFHLDVRFTAQNGITLLFGPSGSGKTTTLRAIAGIVTPDEGRISVGKQVYFDSAAGINLSIQQRRVGYVFQNYALFPHLTAEQNVAYGIKAQALNSRSKRERAREMLALFRIEHTAGRYPHEMSGGEQQRAAVARALASDPAVVLLDEPLSAVDTGTRSRLLEEIDDAQRNTGVPFIYVTHNETEAKRLGTHIIFLDKGKVVQEEVLKLPEN